MVTVYIRAIQDRRLHDTSSCSKEYSILIDNHSAIPVYLIHKTDKIADMQVNRHEKYP